MNWETPPKPAELAEARLIAAILDGRFPIGGTLPAERELADQLGVTRPTLRETLQRLARDGWIEIRHGRSTRVRDYWQEGNLGVLGAIAHSPEHAPADFVPNLLAVRRLLAPAYTRLAVERMANDVALFLEKYVSLEELPATFAEADWNLHHYLTVASGNPIFTLILNGFNELYLTMALVYFSPAGSRDHSRLFYSELRQAAQANDPAAAEAVTQRVMAKSLELWQAATMMGEKEAFSRQPKN